SEPRMARRIGGEEHSQSPFLPPPPLAARQLPPRPVPAGQARQPQPTPPGKRPLPAVLREVARSRAARLEQGRSPERLPLRQPASTAWRWPSRLAMPPLRLVGLRARREVALETPWRALRARPRSAGTFR